jgi:hypothetical protein
MGEVPEMRNAPLPRGGEVGARVANRRGDEPMIMTATIFLVWFVTAVIISSLLGRFFHTSDHDAPKPPIKGE